MIPSHLLVWYSWVCTWFSSCHLHSSLWWLSRSSLSLHHAWSYQRLLNVSTKENKITSNKRLLRISQRSHSTEWSSEKRMSAPYALLNSRLMTWWHLCHVTWDTSSTLSAFLLGSKHKMSVQFVGLNVIHVRCLISSKKLTNFFKKELKDGLMRKNRKLRMELKKTHKQVKRREIQRTTK